MSKVQNKCVLISLEVKTFAGSIKADRISAEAAAREQAQPEWLKCRVERLSSDLKRRIQQVVSLARGCYTKNSAKWFEGSHRIIKASEVARVKSELQDLKLTFDDLIQKEVIGKYNELENEARESLGLVFADVGFPSVNELRDKYAFNISICPIPSVDDLYLEGLGVQASVDIKDAAKQDQSNRVKSACKGLIEDLKKLTDHAAEVLGNVDKKYHDSLFTNITSLAERIPALNITDDPNINKAAHDALVGLQKYDPRQVKKDPEQRKQAANVAASVSKALASIEL